MISNQKLVRKVKDRLIQNYFDWRINTVDDPYQIRLRQKPYKFLFLLGHMRSGSSLITHILNSNPEIIGYGETHTQYRSEADLKKLISTVYWKIRAYGMQHTYILDKLLHDNKLWNESFLASEQIYSLFLIREPARTLASILNIKPDWSEAKATAYYVERLATLERYAKIIDSKNRSLLLDYEQFLKHTNAAFDALQKMLATEVGFSEQYEVMQTTGVKGIGDSSKKIKAGRIIRKPRELPREISPQLVAEGKQAFEQCRATLSQYCSAVDD